MRKEFAALLLKEMKITPAIQLITADLGFGILDDIRYHLPKQFYNVGAAEHLMVGIAIGMAQERQIPICYSMSSFVLYRPFELLRTYINHERIPVKLVGSGRDKDYEHDGISHWAHDDELILKALPNIKIYKPKDLEELERDFREFIDNNEPSYFNLQRKI